MSAAWYVLTMVVTFIVTIYSVLGGLWSVPLTDFVQMFLIVIGMALVVPFALKAGGGWNNVISVISPEKLTLTGGVYVGFAFIPAVLGLITFSMVLQ